MGGILTRSGIMGENLTNKQPVSELINELKGIGQFTGLGMELIFLVMKFFVMNRFEK